MIIQGLSVRIKVALSRIGKLMATEMHSIPEEMWKSLGERRLPLPLIYEQEKVPA